MINIELISVFWQVVFPFSADSSSMATLFAEQSKCLEQHWVQLDTCLPTLLILAVKSGGGQSLMRCKDRFTVRVGCLKCWRVILIEIILRIAWLTESVRHTACLIVSVKHLNELCTLHWLLVKVDLWLFLHGVDTNTARWWLWDLILAAFVRAAANARQSQLNQAPLSLVVFWCYLLGWFIPIHTNLLFIGVKSRRCVHVDHMTLIMHLWWSQVARCLLCVVWKPTRTRCLRIGLWTCLRLVACSWFVVHRNVFALRQVVDMGFGRDCFLTDWIIPLPTDPG